MTFLTWMQQATTIVPQLAASLAIVAFVARWVWKHTVGPKFDELERAATRAEASARRVETVLGSNGGKTLFDIVTTNHREARQAVDDIRAELVNENARFQDIEAALAVDPLTCSAIASALFEGLPPDRQAAISAVIEGLSKKAGAA